MISVNAQEVKFGVKAGVNFASLGADAEDVKARTSIHFGAMAEFMLSDKFSIQPELVYSAQGTKFDDSDDLVTKLDYLNLPILAKYYFSVTFSVEAALK